MIFKTMMPQGHRKFDEAWAVENYPTMSNRDICEILRLSRSHLSRVAALRGLAKAPEWLVYIARIHSARQRQEYKAELRREMFGLEKKSRRRIRHQSSAKYQFRYQMRKKGYLELKGEEHKNILYYPEYLRRRPMSERNAARHGITILPLPDNKPITNP